jgi:hypothetical protein
MPLDQPSKQNISNLEMILKSLEVVGQLVVRRSLHLKHLRKESFPLQRAVYLKETNV